MVSRNQWEKLMALKIVVLLAVFGVLAWLLAGLDHEETEEPDLRRFRERQGL